MDILETAQHWIDSGIAVIPARYKDKVPEVGWKPFQTSLPNTEQLEVWFGSGDHNLAVITGHQGLTVVDFDNDEAYDTWRAWAQTGLKRLVATAGYQVRTSRGVHLYLRLPQATRSRALKRDGARVGIDIKSRGGYVLIPPSVHPDGTEYEVSQSGPIFFIRALSEVLPADLLLDTEQPSPVLARIQPSDDPWQAAASPAYIEPGVVDRIKGSLRIEDLVNIERRTGAGWGMALCPLHDDHNPSLSVNLTEQWVSCRAGCTEKTLDVINLFARMHDLSNSDAIRFLSGLV